MTSLASVSTGQTASAARPLANTALALLLMLMSGFAALGYQIVWTQQCALWLGHEAAAVLAVITAFFGGIALGALCLGALIRRSSRPAVWYAACETVIAAWACVLAIGLQRVADLLQQWIGAEPSSLQHWTLIFCGTFILLLPATAAMGATLPAMERVLASSQSRSSRIAWLYAGNAAGAVIGTLLTTFWLIPTFGLRTTVMTCASANLVCAALASRFFSFSKDAVAPFASTSIRGVLPSLALTGLLGIGYEVIVVRVLSQVAENTVYTFAILLAVYLVGTSLGAAAYARWTDKRPISRELLVQALVAACLWGLIDLSWAPAMHRWLLSAMPPSMGSALASEAILAVLAFLPATYVMGALFSHLSTEASAAGVGFERALAINTLGAALAPLVFGVLLVTHLDSGIALSAIAIGYLLLAGMNSWRRRAQWILAAVTLALLAWGPSLSIIDVPEGGRVVQFREGLMAAVSIVEDARGVATLHINNRQQEGSSITRYSDARQAFIPALLHPHPRRALFLGLGTGATAWSAAAEPSLQVDAVELLPEVVDASAYFTGRFDPQQAPHLITADARRFIHTTSSQYDLIVSDNFHPARSGSSALYTVEHFSAVRERLATGGLFCQWLPLHQLDLATLRSIVRSYLAALPGAYAVLATNSLETPVIGLVSHRDGAPFDIDSLASRLSSIRSTIPRASLGFNDELSVLGNFISGPSSLQRFSARAELNTDDRSVVSYLAPRETYAPTSQPRDRLLSLIHELHVNPDELRVRREEADFAQRLAAYWAARDRFLEIGRDVKPTDDVRGMLARVREPLLSVLAISPDFGPAYDPLLRMAVALTESDADAARDLLSELERLQPDRSEAREALNLLKGH